MNGKGLCFFILSLLMAMVTPVTGQEGVADRLFGGAIVIDQGENKISLEPALARTTFQKQYASFVFPRLLDYDLQGNLIPVMIKSWEEDDSGEKITFHLYDFSIPSKVNRLKSGDLLESIKFLLRTNPLSPAAIILRDVAGVKDYLKGESELEGLEIIDQHTFVFHLEKPQPLLLHAFADINLAPSRFYDRPGLIATGMGAFTKSSLHLLKANLEFVSGRPFIDYILTSKRENIPPDGRRNVKILLDYVALYPEAQKTDGQLVFPGNVVITLR